MSGENYTITYTHETCDPIGSETVKVKQSGSSMLNVTNANQSSVLTLVKIDSLEATLQAVGMTSSIEDTDCDNQL